MNSDSNSTIVKPVRDRLACLLLTLYAFFTLFFVVFLLSGIWNTVWAASLGSDFWVSAVGTELKNIVTYLAVACYAGLFSIIGFFLAMYFSGKALMIHVFFSMLLLISLIAHIVLLALAIAKTSPHMRNEYKQSMIGFITTNYTNPVVWDWMNSNNCNTVSTCNNALNQYLDVRCNIGYAFSIALLSILCLSLLGIFMDIFLMSQLPRDEDDIDENVPPVEQPDAPLPIV